MELPEAFRQEIKEILGKEANLYFECYEAPVFRGVRLNPLKCEADVLRKSLPFPLRPAPFSPFSYYAPEERVGNLPAHHAGMFYSQEPSAASAVTVLDPQPGEKILDLCAAPGGKSTQIAGLMEGRGLLWSNELGKSRAQILLSNMERLGVRNGVVSSCHPEKLCQSLRGYFDRVLVDAPCSGEGMFRRDPQAIREWTKEGVLSCGIRQRSILHSAALAVKEGGILVYSTCTFSREENEDTVNGFLADHPEFVLLPVEQTFGRPALGGVPARRIFPMDGGEGHFVAKFQRIGENPCSVKPFSAFLSKKERRDGEELYQSLFSSPVPQAMAGFGDKILLLPQEFPFCTGIGVIQAGVELGKRRGTRIEPSHGVWMSRSMAECRRALNFSPDDPELAAFLRGEEIDCGEPGYTAVCVNGVTTGFGKASGGRLKNRYPKGLRNKT